MKKGDKRILPTLHIDSELVEDMEKVAKIEGLTMPRIRRGAYAMYVNTHRQKMGEKAKHYKIA